MTDTVRVTLVFPKKSWEEVKKLVPSGERSNFVVKATKKEIQRHHRLESVKKLQIIQEEFKKKYGEISNCVDDIRNMREERDERITGLR